MMKRECSLLIACILDVTDDVIKMPFFKEMIDAHRVKDQFKIGDSINPRELNGCVT